MRTRREALPLGRKESVRGDERAVGDPHPVWEWLSLVAAVCVGSLRRRRARVAEGLLLRQQLAVARRAFAERLRAVGGCPKVVVVAVMRKLLALAWTLRRSSPPFSLSQDAAATIP
jgi:hypothetical protein